MQFHKKLLKMLSKYFALKKVMGGIIPLSIPETYQVEMWNKLHMHNLLDISAQMATVHKWLALQLAHVQ